MYVLQGGACTPLVFSEYTECKYQKLKNAYTNIFIIYKNLCNWTIFADVSVYKHHNRR